MKRKRILFLGLVVVLASSAVAFGKYFSGNDNQLIAPPFAVLSSERDALLDTNHAVFELHFSPALLQNKKEIAIELSCNGVIERIRVTDSTLVKTVEVSPGTYRFNLAAGKNSYREISSRPVTILPGYRTTVAVHFLPLPKTTTQGEDEPVLYRKPVIYLYPETDQAVSVQLTPKGVFSFSYPEYANGWNGTAHPDGSTTIAGKTYPYLFWEASGNPDQLKKLVNYETGFVVERGNVTAFLEEKLGEMGLNARERTDFITFWGPVMAQSGRGFAQFVFNRDYDAIASLNIRPQPNRTFRVYLLWTPLADGVFLHPQPQTIERADRTGFHVVEWGGSEFPSLTKPPVSHEKDL